MAIGKIEVVVGSVSFSGEGEQEWLTAALDKVISAAAELAKLQPVASQHGKSRHDQHHDGDFKETLASHIKSKGGETNQVKRFLATADWLRLRGETALNSSKVSKALSTNQQKKLTNTADCLNQNVAKGHCEKQGDGFYITPDGLKELGHAS